jgi:hypothetical protein
MSIQASTFLEFFPIKRVPWTLASASKDPSPSAMIMLPDSFSSLTQATSCLDSIMLHGYIHQDPVVCTPNYEQTGRENIKTQALLESWYNNLSHLLSQPQQNKSHLLQESITLKIKYHVAYITASPLQRQGELRFDNYLSNFEAIISLSFDWLALSNGLVVRPESVRCSIAGGEHNFGILSGIMLTALHCRCPLLRRRAVGVLTHPNCRKRGTWLTGSAAKIAECFIALEEQHCINPRPCKDIPQSQRVRLLGVCRPTGIFSPYDQPQGAYTEGAGIWQIPRTRANLRFMEQPRQLVLRYVKAPCDVASPIAEICLDL